MSNVAELIVVINLLCLIWIIKAQFVLAQSLDRIEAQVKP